MNPDEPDTTPAPDCLQQHRTGRTRQRQRNAQEIGEHLTAWEASGLSLSAFALRQGLRPSTLYSWRKRQGQAQPLNFVEAAVAPVGLPGPLTVRLAEGVELVGGDVAQLVDFVHRLRGGRP